MGTTWVGWNQLFSLSPANTRAWLELRDDALDTAAAADVARELSAATVKRRAEVRERLIAISNRDTADPPLALAPVLARAERLRAAADARNREFLDDKAELCREDDTIAKLKRREGVVALVGDFPACVVAMEACCGAHHMGRALAALGHTIRLMSPEYVRPYVKAQKNDDRDAEAIAEAATRPTMRFVELKSEAQLDMQMLHRTRDRLVSERTALTNQLRGFLLERGITAPQRRRGLVERLDALAGDESSAISPRARQLVDEMRARWADLDRRITALDDEFAQIARADDAARRLATIPGIGVMNATALIAAVGDASTFGRGRDLAAWLGLVPRQMTTGGRPKLLGITKRGDKYLRKLIIHGARSAMRGLQHAPTPLGEWLRGLLSRSHPNTAVVALANKLARIAWAVLRTGGTYQAARVVPA